MYSFYKDSDPIVPWTIIDTGPAQIPQELGQTHCELLEELQNYPVVARTKLRELARAICRGQRYKQRHEERQMFEFALERIALFKEH